MLLILHDIVPRVVVPVGCPASCNINDLECLTAITGSLKTNGFFPQ